MAKRRPFTNSASFRLALVYIGLFAFSAVALVSFLWFSTAGVLDRQVQAAISADAQGLSERWEEGGVPALVLTIQERLAENIDDDSIYLLTDAFQRRITGNLEVWPRIVKTPSEFYELRITRAGVRAIAQVRRFDLPGGFRLLVGRDVRGRVELRNLLTDTILWSTLLIAGLGLIGAYVIRSLFRRMVADVSATAAAISRGDLSQRVTVTGRSDEFDAMAEAINNMLDRIGKLMDGVRQVSNAIAHDLRTPITRARARLEDAVRVAQSEPELRSAVERAVIDLDGVTAVFQALLRIAEIEAGARRSAFATVDLGPLLADMGELYEAVADERGLTLPVAVPDHLVVQGDRELLQQAVANLLDNAIKFSPAGGAVRLSAAADGDRVWISVADEGPGIPEADRARASERFFRGETARSTPGSGLGLALVAAVAALHEGALTLADANPGLLATIAIAQGKPPAPAKITLDSSAPHVAEGGDVAS